MAFIEGKAPENVKAWAEANREALRLFWASRPGEALELKKIIEARSRTKPTADGTAERDVSLEKEAEPAAADARGVQKDAKL